MGRNYRRLLSGILCLVLIVTGIPAKAGARGAQEHSTTDTNDVEPVQVPDTGDRGFIGFLEKEWKTIINVLQTGQ